MATTNTVWPQAPAVRGPIYLDAALTASSTVVGPWPVDFFSSAEVTVAVLSCSGTINVFLQKLMADGSTVADICHITSLTTSTETKAVSFIHGGNTVFIPSNGVLASGSVLTLNFGSYWRLLLTTTGTVATHSVGVYWEARA